MTDRGRRQQRGVRRLGTLIGIAAAAVLAWVAVTVVLLWRVQERVVFQPPAIVPDAPLTARRVDYRASDGHALYGYLVAPSAGTREPGTVVLAFHGNADLSAWQVPWGRELADRANVTVFLAEYRGYGGIPGTPSYSSAANDARGALAWVRSEYPGARLVLFGHSLGSAVASEIAREMDGERPASLVLQSPFTSAQAMATRMLVPPVPALWSLISRVHYDTRTIVASLEVPVWVAHGTRDVIVPVRMGRAVHAAARNRGELLIVTGAGHNDVADVGGNRYWTWLRSAVTAPAAARGVEQPDSVAQRRL